MPSHRARRGIASLAALAGVACTAVVAATLAVPGPASAVAACTGQVSYAFASNTIKLTSGDVDLPTLKQLCPSAPLLQDPGNATTWELKANLLVQNGATLHVRGTASGVDPGLAVDHLRLMSNAGNAKGTDVVSLTALYGNLDFRDTAVTSWDDAANGPDVDPHLPPNPPAGSLGRAFVRALSQADPVTSAPQQSRMDIANSDVGFLGFDGPEAYGVAYKTEGCGAETPAVCLAVKVTGSQTASHFHDNWMGTYTWGASGMTFDHNEYDHNFKYGLDPHDDSDHLTITNNHSHHNGDHGIICSQRCDHLLISGNEVDHNGTVKLAGVDQVHGIMFHRGVTDSRIENNVVHDQPEGAGIAIYDSSNDIVRNNTLTGNQYGLRVTEGSSSLTFTGNTVRSSAVNAVVTFKGNDPVKFGNPSGVNTALTFSGNIFDGSGGPLADLSECAGSVFTGNVVTPAAAGPVSLDTSTGLTWAGPLPATGAVLTNGSTLLVRKPASAFTATLDTATDVISVVASDGRLAGVTSPVVATTVKTDRTSLVLTQAKVGTGQFTVTPRAAWARTTTGTLTATPTGFGTPNPSIVTKGGAVKQTTTFTVGGLLPGNKVKITLDGVGFGTRVASATGTVSWTWKQVKTGPHTFTLG